MDSSNPSSSVAEPMVQPKVKKWTQRVITITNDILKELLEKENEKRLETEYNDQSDSDDDSARWEQVSARLKDRGIDRSPDTVKARYRNLIVDGPPIVPCVDKSQEVDFPLDNRILPSIEEEPPRSRRLRRRISRPNYASDNEQFKDIDDLSDATSTNRASELSNSSATIVDRGSCAGNSLEKTQSKEIKYDNFGLTRDNTFSGEPPLCFQSSAQSQSLETQPPSITSSIVSVRSRPPSPENEPQAKVPRVATDLDTSFARSFDPNIASHASINQDPTSIASDIAPHKPRAFTPLELYGTTSTTVPENVNSSALLKKAQVSMHSTRTETDGENQASRLKTQMLPSDVQVGLNGFDGTSAESFSRIASVKIKAQRGKLASLEEKKQNQISSLNEDDLKIEELKNQIEGIKRKKETTEAAIKELEGEIIIERFLLNCLEQKVEIGGANAVNNNRH